MEISFDFKEMDHLQTVLIRVGQVPQRAVTKAAGKGTTVVRKAVRGAVPVDTGQLKRGIIRKGERSRVKGKKVYDLMFDPAKNDIFQKPIEEPGTAGGKSSHGYYPASMEYGFLTRSKGGGLDYVPGYHFMRDAAEGADTQARQTMIDTFIAELEKEWLK